MDWIKELNGEQIVYLIFFIGFMIWAIRELINIDNSESGHGGYA